MPVRPDGPTFIKCYGNVNLICIDLDIERTDDIIVKVSLGYCRLNTADLQGMAPKDFASTTEKGDFFRGWEEWDFQYDEDINIEALVAVRTKIRKVLEPSCYDNFGCRVSMKSSVFNNYNEHDICDPRKNIILLLADREEVLSDLKSVDIDLDEQCV